jgi:hypothetical protein
MEGEIPGGGWDLYDRLQKAPGTLVIKAAGNMAWPLGLRTERLAQEIRNAANQYGVSLEHFAGLGTCGRRSCWNIDRRLDLDCAPVPIHCGDALRRGRHHRVGDRTFPGDS